MTDQGMNTLKWGSDYLLRTLAKQKTQGEKYPVYLIAYQLGNYTLDNSMWERPESIKGPRPMYYVTTRNGELAPPPSASSAKPTGCGVKLRACHFVCMRPGAVGPDLRT